VNFIKKLRRKLEEKPLKKIIEQKTKESEIKYAFNKNIQSLGLIFENIYGEYNLFFLGNDGYKNIFKANDKIRKKLAAET
jgi:hypothetical protein